ncbi:MAG: 16S rRNA (uracil(1498)-N(3))-methyltransferase [Terricaulis sp.]
MFWLAVASGPEQLALMADPRLLIEQRLGVGARLTLDEAQARHVGTVLRLDAGDALRVFNAEDGEWRARVSEKAKRSMSVRVEDFLRPARAAPDLELLFAPVKRHATDLIAEKATELGARRLRPVITQRTIAETVRIDRLQTIAREAAEQTERFDLPEIVEPVTLAKALDGWDAARPLIFADEEGDAPPIADVARSLDRRAGVSMLIGPEGGFTSEERRMLRSLSFIKPVSLGPRILRAETAVIAALSTLQAHWGDWREV